MPHTRIQREERDGKLCDVKYQEVSVTPVTDLDLAREIIASALDGQVAKEKVADIKEIIITDLQAEGVI